MSGRLQAGEYLDGRRDAEVSGLQYDHSRVVPEIEDSVAEWDGMFR